MDHGETATTSRVIALRNARPQMYIYMFTMIAQTKFSLLFSKNDKIYLYQYHLRHNQTPNQKIKADRT